MDFFMFLLILRKSSPKHNLQSSPIVQIEIKIKHNINRKQIKVP